MPLSTVAWRHSTRRSPSSRYPRTRCLCETTLGAGMSTVWHEVGPAGDAPPGALRQVEVEGRRVCVGRTTTGWVAFDDTCPHEECPLSDGELDGDVVVCPCHGSEFDVRTGDVLTPPALEPLPIFDAREAGGLLLVSLSAPAAAEVAAHEREDHVPATVARTAGVDAPSTDGLALDDV